MWQTIKEFGEEQPSGDCWIVYRRKVFKAYFCGKASKDYVTFQFNGKKIDVHYVWEDISHVFPIHKPGVPSEVELLNGTNFQVLEALVPDIEARMKNNPKVMAEIVKRGEEQEHGFRPFEWLSGSM